MNNIHVNVYRHVEIHKRIHDMGWVVEKQTRRVCGEVSPDLSLQVHSRVFDLAVKTCMRSFRRIAEKPACVLFEESPKFVN